MSEPGMPRVTIDPPEPRDRRFGLYSVTRPRALEAHESFGVEFDPDSCALPSALSAGPCDDPPEKATYTEGDRGFGDPFAVYAALECRPVGRNLQEIRDRARRVLALGEEATVERHLWGVMASLASDLTPTAGTPVPFFEALALLERAMAPYGMSGILYAPREQYVLAQYHGAGYVERHDQQLETSIGTRWLFADHPSPTPGPGGNAAGTGEFWMYAVGQIEVIRGEIETPGPLGSTLTRVPTSNSDSNNTFSLAERVIVPVVSCPTFAVLVSEVP